MKALVCCYNPISNEVFPEVIEADSQQDIRNIASLILSVYIDEYDAEGITGEVIDKFGSIDIDNPHFADISTIRPDVVTPLETLQEDAYNLVRENKLDVFQRRYCFLEN